MIETKSIAWHISWTRAFPTLAKTLFPGEIEWHEIAWLVIQGHLDDRVVGKEEEESTQSSIPWQKESLGYGEVTPKAVIEILNFLRSKSLLLQEDSIIADLGSGNGRVLLAAATASSVQKAIGIEILEPLHVQALANHQEWDRLNLDSSQTVFDFKCADFTKDTQWMEAQLVFLHATVFEAELMKVLNELCSQCREGTIFVVVTKRLEATNIRTVGEMRLEMDWGQATVYVQRLQTLSYM
jgi:SAM-dependent methyltransferase